MILRIEHIGIAVKNLEVSNELFTKLLNETHYKIEEVALEHVKTAFFKMAKRKLNYWKRLRPKARLPIL